MSIKTRNILSVVVGVITIFVTGFLLYPILYFFIEKRTIDSILYEFAWLVISSFLGGFVTSYISRSFYQSLITGAVAATTMLVIAINNLSLITFVAAATSFFLCFMGGLIQNRSIKKYKNE